MLIDGRGRRVRPGDGLRPSKAKSSMSTAAPSPRTDSRSAAKVDKTAPKGGHSSDQFNDRIGVIPQAMRTFAASTTIIIAAALVWAVLGAVPTRVAGNGMILADLEGNFAVAA